MGKVVKIIGGAGTGKTTELLRLMEEIIETGVSPMSIGFVSFTKAARREAAERASRLFGCTVEELERYGWFRTLHSICYQQTQAGKMLLTDSDREWLTEALGSTIKLSDNKALDDFEVLESAATKASAADQALAFWQAARNRLLPLEEVWEEAFKIDQRITHLDRVLKIVDNYETAKRVQKRVDFTDMLGRFAGIRFDPEEHNMDAQPMGDVPDVPVWFLDEQQDTSALLDAVCKRLTENADQVFVVGDNFQSIYGFAGSDAKFFLNWPADEQRIMPRSYRCPPCIMEAGEKMLRRCSDYWDRGIKPSDGQGAIICMTFKDNWVNRITERIDEEWLVIARSNLHAQRLAKVLDNNDIPWRSTRGGNKWNSPKRNRVYTTLLALRDDLPITHEEFNLIREVIPMKVKGHHPDGGVYEAQLFRRRKKSDPDVPYDTLGKWDELIEWGATEEFKDFIMTGKWHRYNNIICRSGEFFRAFSKYGISQIMDPKVRIGTIHSVKGAEADNVIVLASGSKQVTESMKTKAGRDAEHRLAYVAVTRARKRLYILKERTTNALPVTHITPRVDRPKELCEVAEDVA